MEFFLYTFGSDYLKENFIALESCSLLCSKLPRRALKVFFTRDIRKDCECDILVVETLRRDILMWVKTQVLARTVLVTSTPFTSLNAFLVMGLECSLVCMNKDEVLFSTEARIRRREETELEKFSRQFGIERSHELDLFTDLLDVGMLRRKLWLVGSIKSKALPAIPCSNQETVSRDRDDLGLPAYGFPSSVPISYPYELADDGGRRKPGDTESQRQDNLRGMKFSYRTLFRSSSGEPSEVRPLNHMRPTIQRPRYRIVEIPPAQDETESTDSHTHWVSEHSGGGSSYPYVEDGEQVIRVSEGVLHSLGSVPDGIAVRNSERRKRKLRRKTAFELGCGDRPM